MIEKGILMKVNTTTIKANTVGSNGRRLRPKVEGFMVMNDY